MDIVQTDEQLTTDFSQAPAWSPLAILAAT